MSDAQTPIDESARIEGMLRVGMACMCYPEPTENTERFHKAIVRGWQAGAYLIAEVMSPDEQRIALAKETPCLFKFRHEGATWRFDSTVADRWDTPGGVHYRFSWPEELRKAPLRRHERVDVMLPCNVVYENEGTWLKGQIRDLGSGGVRLCVKAPPAAGAPIHLSFTLPDGTTLEDVRSVVRSAAPYGKGAFLGVQFADDETEAKRDVELFVSTQLERQRKAKRGSRQVLIIEKDPKLAAGLRRSLERRGFDVATASGVVDGFALLRNLLPSVLMANVEHGLIDGADLCRVVRGTPGFRKLPVFLYGPADSGLEARATAAGASGYIPFGGQSVRIVDSMFGAIPGPADEAGPA